MKCADRVAGHRARPAFHAFRFRPNLTTRRDFLPRLLVLFAAMWAARAGAQTVVLAPVFVTASRSAEAADSVPFSHVALSGDDLRDNPATTIDGALRGLPEFSLFRRTDSLVANPTTQGVSLRGLGPSGASRSLVLLDGVPLNDPFGGWIFWSEVPRESLAGVEVVPGGGGSAWGNAALGGVIQLLTEPATGRRERFMAATGSLETHEAEAQVTEPVGSGTLQLLGRDFSTGGYSIVAPERRGPIDVPATSRSHSVTARWSQPVGDDATVMLTFRTFAESRGNGTPYQNNSARATFGSATVTARPSKSFQWTATLFAQDQDFASTFSSVNATRTAETPASNQFAVPTTAEGAAWTGEWTGPDDARTTIGLDVHDARGETREDSAYVAGAFTRRRYAGGRQSDGGIFALHSRAITGTLRASIGVRADEWIETDGHRRDYLLGAPAGDLVFPRQDGLAFSPSGGMVWQASGLLRLHATAQQAFRRPTLNELYRPFRVGNVITDANPLLSTEKVTGTELGADLVWKKFTLGVAGFQDNLRDPVANVTIAEGPANVPGIGVVPAGGEARRRLNLDEVRVQGATVSARWQIAPALSATGEYLLDDSKVLRASVAPQLEGLRLAEVPVNSATVGLDWRPGHGLKVVPRLRWIGAQFDDDLNTLRLAPATIVDLTASLELPHGVELFLTGENLANRRIETGRSVDGVVNVGTPRLILIGFRWQH
jgi:outer membrane receptor protein involved in Fe transport